MSIYRTFLLIGARSSASPSPSDRQHSTAIARDPAISPETVGNRVFSIFGKCRVAERAAPIGSARKAGLGQRTVESACPPGRRIAVGEAGGERSMATRYPAPTVNRPENRPPARPPHATDGRG